MLLIRATMRMASYTLPIWLTWRVWKLLVHLLVIAERPLWWWMLRVEGHLIIQHLLLLVMAMVVLTSIVRKLVLICPW
jgi:hypothetical protein